MLFETSVRCAEGMSRNVLYAILHRRSEALLSVDAVILHRLRWMPVLDGGVEKLELDLDLDLELGPSSATASRLSLLLLLFLSIMADFI